MHFKFGEISTYIPDDLSPLEIGIAILSFCLLTMTVLFTILDYTSKAKHINKKEW